MFKYLLILVLSVLVSVMPAFADVTLWTMDYVGEYDVTIDTKVSKTGNETIAGTKTFSSFPVTPSAAPTVNYQVANKKFVDDSIAGVVKEKYALLQEQQASGVAGGTFTSGAWRTRTLNTEVADLDGIVSLAANQFTLAAGTYTIRAIAAGHVVDQHKLALYTISDAAYTAYGTSSKASSTSDGQTYAELVTQFTIAVPKIFELHHRCSTTAATNGFGRNCGFGVIEIYAQVEIWKAN